MHIHHQGGDIDDNVDVDDIDDDVGVDDCNDDDDRVTIEDGKDYRFAPS